MQPWSDSPNRHRRRAMAALASAGGPAPVPRAHRRCRRRRLAQRLRGPSGCVAAAPADPRLKELAKSIHGTVVAPGSPAYAEARLAESTRFDAIHPHAVVYCANAGDVEKTILWARKYGVHVVPRSGGHSYGGYSTTTGVVIDVSRLNADPRRAGREDRRDRSRRAADRRLLGALRPRRDDPRRLVRDGRHRGSGARRRRRLHVARVRPDLRQRREPADRHRRGDSSSPATRRTTATSSGPAAAVAAATSGSSRASRSRRIRSRPSRRTTSSGRGTRRCRPFRRGRRSRRRHPTRSSRCATSRRPTRPGRPPAPTSSRRGSSSARKPSCWL